MELIDYENSERGIYVTLKDGNEEFHFLRNLKGSVYDPWQLGKYTREIPDGTKIIVYGTREYLMALIGDKKRVIDYYPDGLIYKDKFEEKNGDNIVKNGEAKLNDALMERHHASRIGARLNWYLDADDVEYYNHRGEKVLNDVIPNSLFKEYLEKKKEYLEKMYKFLEDGSEVEKYEKKKWQELLRGGQLK